MTIQVTAFRSVPIFAQGFVKDLRVRWALEEAGLAYEATLIDRRVQDSADYRRWQPFGQVPAYRDESVELFESGAIVLYLAGQSEALAPSGPAGLARVTSWVIAAQTSVEPHAQNFIALEDSPQRARAEEILAKRLAALTTWLGANDYLEGRFTAGDLMMTTVLRELVDGGFLARYPSLDAYRERCETRPAFARALEAQLRPFRQVG